MPRFGNGMGPRRFRASKLNRMRGGFLPGTAMGPMVNTFQQRLRQIVLNKGVDAGYAFANRYGIPMEIAAPIIGFAANYAEQKMQSVLSKATNAVAPVLSPNGGVKNIRPARELGLGVKSTSFTMKGRAKLLRGMNVSRSTIVSNIGATLGVTSTSQYGRQLVTLLGNSSVAFVSPNTSATLEQAATDLFPSSSLSWKLQPSYVSVKYAFSNMDRVTAVLDLYDLVANQDMSNVAGATAPLWDPVNVFTRAVAQYSSTSGTSTIDDLDSTPIKNYYFTKFWKILKRTRIYLAPGETHEHTFTMMGSYPISRTRFSANATYLKGITYCPMAIIKSCPIRDSGAGNAVTLGTPDLIMTAQIKQTYRGQLVTPIVRRESSELTNTLVGIQNIRLVNNPQEIEAGDTSNTDTTADRTNE